MKSLRPHPEAGFSVIEALAAVAILAVALIPLATVQLEVVRGDGAAAARTALLQAQENALAVLDDTNVGARPEGHIDLGAGFDMDWRALALTPFVKTARPDGMPGAFEAAVFDVVVRVSPQGGGPAAEFHLDQVGWRSAGQAATRPTE